MSAGGRRPFGGRPLLPVVGSEAAVRRSNSSISSSFIMWCSLPTRAHTSIGSPHSSMKPAAAVCENSSSVVYVASL